MTLKNYYYSLPTYIARRKDFIRRVADECGVTEQTARNWCIYDVRPQDFAHVHKLSQLTGISEDDLWEKHT